ncbi:MAG: hypothetical protein HKN16_06000 [Saprospiraceae bacterium]|nr:hypothetical protein [Saprospiraceae bacterium]
MSKSFQAFVLIAALLFVANLFFGNGLLRILEPWELDFLRYSRTAESINSIPALVQSFALDSFGPDSNYLRLGGLGIMLFSLFAFISLSRPLFGREVTTAFFLVAASSPVLVFLMKISIPDLWLAGVHLMSIPFLLRGLKQPQIIWSTGFGILMLLGGFMHPGPNLLWYLLWIGALIVLHPQGKRLINIQYWWPLPFLVYQYFSIDPGDGWLFYWGSVKPLFSLLIFFLIPIIWVGFFSGGLRDLFWKVRKKEESGLIFLSWFIAAFFTLSPALGLLFLLIAAKQLQLFFTNNYPWKSWVRSAEVFALISFFLLAIAFVFNQFESLGAGALRYTLIVIGLFWASAFWAVIGVFSVDRSWIVGGKAFVGLVPVFIAIILLLPFLERDNNWQKELLVKQVPEFLEKNDLPVEVPICFADSLKADPQLSILLELSKHSPSNGKPCLSLQVVGQQTDKRKLTDKFPLPITGKPVGERYYLELEN